MANFWAIYDRAILTVGSVSGVGALVQSYRAISPSPQPIIINATGSPMSPTGWAIAWWAAFVIFGILGVTGLWIRSRKEPQEAQKPTGTYAAHIERGGSNEFDGCDIDGLYMKDTKDNKFKDTSIKTTNAAKKAGPHNTGQ
jgi:hypothetical protein